MFGSLTLPVLYRFTYNHCMNSLLNGNRPAEAGNPREEKRMIKCVVWDLDDTLWSGALLEDDSIGLKDNVVEIIKTLDSRGILQSIASKNDYDHAMDRLRGFGLAEYFLYPQINW